MKKISLLLLAVFLFLSVTPFASASPAFDLSGLSYDELVALKDQINLAMWNSEEWQEVKVPQGIWEVGTDIPVGHWTITAAPNAWLRITYGNVLQENGKNVSWGSDGYLSESLYGTEHVFYNEGDLNSIDIDMKAGYYIEIEDGSVIFTPYSGKPDLGFK